MHLVEVGVVVAREALPGCVGHPAHVLLVSLCLPLTGGLDHPQLGAPLLLLLPLAGAVPTPGVVDVSLQLVRHPLQGHDLNLQSASEDNSGCWVMSRLTSVML